MNPNYPGVLLIGDSITGGYGPKVADARKGKASVARLQARNEIAAEIVAREGIAVDDLYGLVKDHPEYWSPDGVHFNAQGVVA
jgi:lysophospholipase L1-like esterase